MLFGLRLYLIRKEFRDLFKGFNCFGLLAKFLNLT
jgi:hypothetical protein